MFRFICRKIPGSPIFFLFGFGMMALLFQPERGAAQDFGGQLAQISESEDLMGYAAIAFCKGETLAFYGGRRDAARNLPVNADTKFRVASVSKLVTALAVLYLHDTSELNIYEPASSWLNFELSHPDYLLTPITPAMLLTHRSGIQDGDTYFDFIMDSYYDEVPPSLWQVFEPGAAYYAPNNWRPEAPGSFFMYSNLNFALLASVIESVTQTRFDVFMRETFLPLLDIPGSFNISDIEDINDVAVLYRKPGATWEPQFENWQGNAPLPRELPDYEPGDNGMLFAPQGGLRTTAEGLWQVGRLFLGNGTMYGNTESEAIITEETMDGIMQIQWAWDGNNGNTYYDLYYAFSQGAHHTTNQPGDDVLVPGYSFIGHPGASYGLASSLYVQPEVESGILFITNGVGEGLRFDERSAFFTTETDVFEAYNAAVFQPCLQVTHLEEPTEHTGQEIQLLPAYPNPFNARAQLRWQQEQAEHIVLEVFNSAGQRVWRQDRTYYAPGTHQQPFQAGGLSSGIYLVRLHAPSSGMQKTAFITLLK